MKHLLLTAIAVLLALNLSAQCSFPTGFSATGGDCTIELNWDNIPEASYYKIKYKKQGSTWNNITTTNPASFFLTGLEANTKYQFKISSKCGASLTPFSPKIMGITSVCQVPLNLIADAIDEESASISWDVQCGINTYQLKWKETDDIAWNTISGIDVNAYHLTGLNFASAYDIVVQSVCGAFTTEDSEVLNFTTLAAQRPNIVVILTDDSRNDQYRVNGAPEYLELPAIERIANEGVNFKVATVSTPVCTPSRAIMYTGLYATSNGALRNAEPINPGIKTISEILHDDGYYTAFVGKYGTGLGSPVGYDNWVVTSTLNYVDPMYTFNDVDTTILGNILEVLPQLCLEFLNEKPAGQPFMLTFCHRAPHANITALPEDAFLFEDDTILFPSNFYSYANDYPSYYDLNQMKWRSDSLETIENKREEYRALVGIDRGVQQILDWLEANEQLDNTLIIYTSDNGFMQGEHLLDNKGTALKESMIIPLFARYPDWFNGQIITDEIASMVDVPKTILELAGIVDTFGMQGLSLNALASGIEHRQMILHQSPSIDILPYIRSVRSLDYLYTFHFCEETVEEFFDLEIDSDENINQIFNPAYASIIDEYRFYLDSLRLDIGDTLQLEVNSCHLISDAERLGNSEVISNDIRLTHFKVFPIPATDMLNVQIDSKIERCNMILIDMQGKLIKDFKSVQFVQGETQLNVSDLPAGNYQLVLQLESGTFAYQIQMVH